MRNPASASTSKTPCCTKVGLKRGPWTPEEDELLANYVKREGEGRWRTLPKRAGLLRCGKSCRLRWMNYLRPSVKRGQIAPDEEDLILRLHRLLGNRWSLIAGRIPGRTDNEIKNYWNTHLSKKLISQGIDPRTHKPLNPKPNPSPDVNAPVSKSIPNANPNPSSSRVGEIGSNHEVKEIESNENHKEPPNLDQYHSPLAADSNENWQSADGLVTGLQSTHGTSNDDEDDIGFCNDDTFSSFLNSLINEDVFGNHNHHQQQQQQQQLQQVQQPSNVIAPLPHPAISVQATFNSSPRTVWEPAALTSTSAPLVHDQKDSMSP
ncbi:hypothetical protein AAG906_036551 [Vitis piasezkii]